VEQRGAIRSSAACPILNDYLPVFSGDEPERFWMRLVSDHRCYLPLFSPLEEPNSCRLQEISAGRANTDLSCVGLNLFSMNRIHDIALPLHDGVSAWYAALQCLNSRLSYPRIMGMTGGVYRTLFCANDCLCFEQYREREQAIADVEAQGYRVLPLNLSTQSLRRLHQRLLRAWQRGMPVVWFDPEREGLLTDYSPDKEVFTLEGVDQLGERNTTEQTTAQIRSLELYRVGRSRRHIGLNSRRVLNALLEWVAFALRAPVWGRCAALPPSVPCGAGLAAYSLWAEALKRDPPRMPGSLHVLIRRARRWQNSRLAAAEFLCELAGTRRSAFANRLRYAATLFVREAQEAWTPLLQTQHAATTLVRRAQSWEQEAVGYLMEAVVIALHLPAAAGRALLEPPEEPLTGIALQEMIYLARAGSPPLRLLAARRLTGSDHPQAVSTLTQLLYDSEETVSEMALHILAGTPSHRGIPVLRGVYRSLAESGEPGDMRLRRAIASLPGVIPAEERESLCQTQ
jgi:hypothetical protein